MAIVTENISQAAMKTKSGGRRGLAAKLGSETLGLGLALIIVVTVFRDRKSVV